jgi:hypothetical protein
VHIQNSPSIKKGIKIFRLLSIIYFSNESKAGETNKNHFFILLFNRLFSSLALQVYCPLFLDFLCSGTTEHPRKAIPRSVGGKTMEAGKAGPASELLSPPPPPPGSSKRSGKRARDGPLLFGTQLMRHEGKEEPGDAAPQGAEAIAVVPWEPPAEKQPPPTAVQVDKGKLYCSLCSCVLTPPIYQVGFLIFLVAAPFASLAPISISPRQISISNGCCRLRFGVLVASSARWGIWRAAPAA